MSPSTPPSPEAFIDSFPNTLPKIEGPPTYDSLAHLKDLIKANAASVTSTRGGGTHGYLGIVLSPEAYATIDPIAFVVPANPGTHPVFPNNAPTAAQISEAVRTHEESLREWREYTNLEQALKKQITQAIDPVYLRALKDRNTGYANVTTLAMLQFLFTTYGLISPIDLISNHKKIEAPWDPNTPFEMLIDQIEDCQELAEAGNQPYTAAQILNNAYALVFNTGMYFDDCKAWDARPAAEKTWNNFKTHFLAAQQQLRRQQQTTQQAGFHSANAATAHARYEEAAEALANLATATSADRKAMETLTNTIENLTQQLKTKDAELKKLQDQLGTKTPRIRPPRKDNGSYCHTHGFLVASDHGSGNCKNPGPNHKAEATRENTMGGNQTGKPAG